MTFFNKENELFATFNVAMFKGLAVSSIAILQETNKGVQVVTIPTNFVGKDDTTTTNKLMNNLLKTFVAELTANDSCKLDDDYNKDFVSLAKFYTSLNKGVAVLQVVNDTLAKVVFTSPKGVYLNKVFPKKNTLVDLATLNSANKRAKINTLAKETIARFDYDAKVVKFFDDMTKEFAKVSENDKKVADLKKELADLNKELKELADKALKETNKENKEKLAKELKTKRTLKENKEKELADLNK